MRDRMRAGSGGSTVTGCVQKVFDETVSRRIFRSDPVALLGQGVTGGGGVPEVARGGVTDVGPAGVCTVWMCDKCLILDKVTFTRLVGFATS